MLFDGCIMFHHMGGPHLVYPSPVEGHMDCFYLWLLQRCCGGRGCAVLFRYLSSSLWGESSGVGLLGSILSLRSAFKDLPGCYPPWPRFSVPPAMRSAPDSGRLGFCRPFSGHHHAAALPGMRKSKEGVASAQWKTLRPRP